MKELLGVPTMMEDRAGTKTPTVDTINNRNKTTSGKTKLSGAPRIQVYQPDFGGLEKSFQDIMNSYGEFRNATRAQFDANKAGLDLNLQQSVENIGEAKEDTKTAFAKSRQQLSEDVYSANRQTTAQMSARGLSGSGVEALANLQTRMQAGEATSDLANEFFDAQEGLAKAEVQTREQYNVSLQSLNASLQGAMAQIMSQEASTRMDYTQMVDNLKRQVVQDANAVRMAQAEWNRAQAQLEEGSTITNTMVQQVLHADTPDDFKVANLIDFGYSPTEANAMVRQYKSTAGTGTQALQSQINNLLNLGYGEDELKQLVAQQVLSGADIDVASLNFSITPTNSPGGSTGKGTRTGLKGGVGGGIDSFGSVEPVQISGNSLASGLGALLSKGTSTGTPTLGNQSMSDFDDAINRLYMLNPPSPTISGGSGNVSYEYPNPSYEILKKRGYIK